MTPADRRHERLQVLQAAAIAGAALLVALHGLPPRSAAHGAALVVALGCAALSVGATAEYLYHRRRWRSAAVAAAAIRRAYAADLAGHPDADRLDAEATGALLEAMEVHEAPRPAAAVLAAPLRWALDRKDR